MQDTHETLQSALDDLTRRGYTLKAMRQSDAEYISRRIHINTTTGCWEWTMYTGFNGYGHTKRSGFHGLAHRLSYEAMRGPIPDGLQIDHLCRNTSCVNPWHLEPVTSHENTMRAGTSMSARHAAATHCKRGHLFDEANTRIERRSNGKMRRQCRTCASHRALVTK